MAGCKTALLIIAAAVATVAALPNGYAWGCLPGNISATLPFCKTELPIGTRVEDLLTRMTDEEVMGLLGMVPLSLFVLRMGAQ